MRDLIALARGEGVTHMAFGDLFLRDIRDYRERQLEGSGITPLFPLWTTPDATRALAREMLTGGLRAVLTCVDPRQLDPRFVGMAFDDELLSTLPASVDPCGEKGEFHTFCHTGPMFARRIGVRVGECVERDGFWFADVVAEE
jgi:diphthamide synthase (EF-2-diphthine--ammonia ligase)